MADVHEDDNTMIVTLTVAQLREIVRSEIEQALADRTRQPALLDREGLARMLGVSPASVDRMRAAGLPTMNVTRDAPRFVLADVIAWIKLRTGSGKALRVVK